MTQEELHRARRELRLLVLRTADGRDVYPAFQIVDGKLVTGLREVLLELRRGTHDSWTWAQWLGAPNESAGPGTALRNIDRLVAGAVSETIRAATQSAVIWAS
ncbi:hypothetical protein M2390_000197 [Mycetocola sp. BIGb0189]|uniref:hypothetical protein n=1 Tax=Mycetocola sp. BIGb0189 TaxID=2940604 RepID=UPI00216814AA|nr:hypothetical protein [Mycetocola sp. BIGb0189]MCS4275039.1 hypothetical protein [Mycetocola sp. BIGb0189]